MPWWQINLISEDQAFISLLLHQIPQLLHSLIYEGVSHILVTDTEAFQCLQDDWLTFVCCHHVLATLRHPQSDGIVQNFVRTVKSATKSNNACTFDEFDGRVDNFLIQYPNLAHVTTGSRPTKLFKNCLHRTSLLQLLSSEIILHRGGELRPSKEIAPSQ